MKRYLSHILHAFFVCIVRGREYSIEIPLWIAASIYLQIHASTHICPVRYTLIPYQPTDFVFHKTCVRAYIRRSYNLFPHQINQVLFPADAVSSVYSLSLYLYKCLYDDRLNGCWLIYITFPSILVLFFLCCLIHL